MIKIIITENQMNNLINYKKWKKKNVTFRGIKNPGLENGVYGSFGKGLYTVPLSNKKMALEYGELYFIVNGKPKTPKIFETLNHAEIFKQKIIQKFCQENNVKYSFLFFEKNTSFEKEMLKLGYDGIIIKGREMVNYTPENVKFFKTENGLIDYYLTSGEVLTESIDPKSRRTDLQNLLSVINGERGICTVNLDHKPKELIRLIKEYNLNTLHVPSNPHKFYIVFVEEYRKNAEKLVEIAEKYNGYFSYKATKEDTIQIGRLLGYDEENIQNYVKERY